MRRRATIRVSLLAAAVALILVGGSLPAAGALKVGKPAPDFSLVDWHERGKHSLSDFEGETNLVLIFGCTTCWNYVSQIKAVNALTKKYKKQPVKFVTIYTREADSDWQPKTSFERTQTALMLGFAHPILTMQTIKMDVWIDDMKDSVFKAYGGVHGSVFVIDKKGKITYKASSVDTEAIAEALDDL